MFCFFFIVLGHLFNLYLNYTSKLCLIGKTVSQWDWQNCKPMRFSKSLVNGFQHRYLKLLEDLYVVENHTQCFLEDSHKNQTLSIFFFPQEVIV